MSYKDKFYPQKELSLLGSIAVGKMSDGFVYLSIFTNYPIYAKSDLKLITMRSTNPLSDDAGLKVST